MARILIDREEKENVEWHEITPARVPHAARRRLLITTDNFLPRWDGISRFLAEIIPRLAQEYDITVIAPDYGFISMEGVRIVKIPLGARRLGDYTPARFAYKTILHEVRQSDIVFNQALGPIGMCAIIAAKRARRPIIGYIHSIEWELLPKALAGLGPLRGFLYPISKSLVRFFYNRCTLLITPSENIAELFSWQRIRTQKRVVHLGVDTAKFTSGERKKAREALNLPQDAYIVGYHGRIGHEKNLITLLRGFRQLRVANKRLVIVGDGVPSLKAKLQRFNDVVVTGSTNHVTPWLQAMDVYVQPSLTETTSLAVLEAMSSGLPVVTSKVGFIPYYIIDGQNGMFFDNTSPYDLSRKLALLHHDGIKRAALGNAARRTVIAGFDWKRTAQGIIDVIDSV
jgi:glycosyltransferase involved in cell wall biosynthesis